VSRLRPLSESECYTRLYGGRDSTVEVIREPEADRRVGGLLEEQMRQLVAERYALDRDDVPDVEAA
jgi:hypothetical protein